MSAETLIEDRNDVVVVGRLSAAPTLRELPSGDAVMSFRVVVRRPPDLKRRPGAATVDSLECAVWRGDVRRVVRGWGVGDVVEISGAVRRRFWRRPGGAGSRWEIEVRKARRLARA